MHEINAYLIILQSPDVSSSRRRLIGQYVSANNDVISHVNMSAVRPLDGGWVTCRAANRFGSVSHTARLNIYGGCGGPAVC